MLYTKERTPARATVYQLLYLPVREMEDCRDIFTVHSIFSSYKSQRLIACLH